MGEKNLFLWIILILGWATAVAQPSSTGVSSGQGQDVRIFNTSRINSGELEFCPAIYENGLVYVSRYKNGPIDPRTGVTYFELFYAEFDPNGMPGKPESFSTEINSAYHEGPVSFNRNGNRIFFSRTNTRNGVRRADGKGKTGLKIYEATRGLYDWENVQELPFNSDDFTCFHPALSPDESKLYFASNRPGGYGGMDLYVVEWQNGNWSAPINLGPEVNTSKNEAFPFVHESGVLFFASEGHPGLGKFDLFMIDVSGYKWGDVYNLGPPFNSAEDDLGLVITADGKSGYFSSSRSGGFGQDDVYMFTTEQGLRGLKPPTVINGVVSVTDKSLSRRLTGVSVRLFELNKEGLIDDESAYDLELLSSNETPGEMVMKLVRKKDESLGSPLAVTDRNGEAIIKLNQDKDYLLLVSKPGYFSKELTFKTDKLGADQPLDLLLEPTNCIILTGKVKSDRFQIPVANADIKLVSSCDGSVTYYRSNMKGEYEICLPMGCDFDLEASKLGYEMIATQLTTAKLRGSRSLSVDLMIHPTSDAILREPIREGTIFVLEKIYYDFNKSAIRKGAAQDLEALSQLMISYPSMQIEMGAHTDSRGTSEYNLDLSLRRAESAKEFLMQRGIASDRIRTVGYGEAQPKNHCVDGVECNEEDYRINRRTEVKVLNIDERIKVSFDEGGASN